MQRTNLARRHAVVLKDDGAPQLQMRAAFKVGDVSDAAAFARESKRKTFEILEIGGNGLLTLTLEGFSVANLLLTFSQKFFHWSDILTT
jgi:dihydrofolate reductase